MRYKTKLVVLLGTFLSLVMLASAQKNGSVSGKILTSDGQPAAGVSVQVLRTSWGTVSNDNGEFRIPAMKPGTYSLKVSAIGMSGEEKSITVAAGQNVQVDFNLKENASELQEVIISNRHLNKQNNIIAKMPLKNLENPQVYSSVNTEILKQQNITNFDDAMRNIPGLTRTWESTGRAGDGGAYFALRGFEAQAALTNGFPGLVSGDLDPANIEEIQVLKGPSGTLFGGSFYAYGGMINVVTKKPYFQTGGELSYQFGSFGLNRVTADINTPLSKKDKIALRVNTAYHTENSFQDAGFRKSFFIAPSLTYQANDKLTFQVLTEILDEERAVAPVFFHSDRFSPLDFKTIRELNLNPKLSFTSNDLTIRNPRFNMQAQAVYKFSDKWSSQTVVSRSSIKSDGIYSYIWDDVAGDNWFSQYFHNENQATNTTGIQQNFNGDFNIGGLRNRVVFGLDFYGRTVIENGSGWGWGRSVTPQGDVSYTDPFTGDEMPPVYLTKFSVDKLLADLPPANSDISNNSYGAYLSDVLNITPNLMAMASIRADYFDTKGEKTTGEGDYNQWAFSPKFGLVYQVVPDRVSLFGNYMNAFINVSPNALYDENQNFLGYQTFKPEQANQWEAGVKANLLEGKLLATASYYDIKVSDRVLTIPGQTTTYLQGGKVGSKGFELDVTASPAKGFNLVAGYSHTKTKVIEGVGTDFYAEKGRVIGGQGPSDLANLWANYVVQNGKAKGLGFGVGGNYAGKYLVIDNSQTGQFFLPSYTLLNAAVSYAFSNFRVALNGNNLLNKQYYIGYWSVNPQKKLNFVASVAYKF